MDNRWACDILSVGEVLGTGAMTFEELNEHFVPGLGFPLEKVLSQWMEKGVIIRGFDGKYRWNYEF